MGRTSPRNHESGGKRLSNRTLKGNLRRALGEAAWAATHKKNCCLRAFFHGKAGKHGIRKVIAAAHRLLLIAFRILRDGTEYREPGHNYFERLHLERSRNRLVRRLEKMGSKSLLNPEPTRKAGASLHPHPGR